MKASLFILVLLLAVSIIFVGCQPSVDNKNDADIDDNNSASVGDNPDVSENDKKDDVQAPENSEDIGESEDELPENEENHKIGEEETETGEEETKEEEKTTPLPEVGTKVGNRFADVTLTTMDGGSINTADLRGKIVILNLWASWCGPCKVELPDFDKIATEYKDQVVIIAADIDAGTGNAYSYVQKNFPESDIVFAYDTVYGTAYYLAGGNGYVPYTAIMDQNGVIVYTDSGVLSHARLVSIIEGLLK